MRRLRLALLASAACLIATAFPAAAQWSSDPATPRVIADRTGEQVQTKMVPTADGGFYVSWFDSSEGYSVYLQRLDAEGVEQWAHNGVRIALRSFTSTQDYGLAIDTSGNALLAFRFQDGGGIAQILGQKVSPTGALLWSAPGVIVSNDVSGANSPRVAATSDGGVGVAWSSSSGAIRVQKLSGSGSPLWGANGITVTQPSGSFFLADLHGDLAGNLIASWSAQLSFSNRQMWAQKFASADGAGLWGAPVVVFNAVGGAMQLGYFPPFTPDGSGGAVFVWYTVGVSAGTVRVQHLNASGVQAFAQNGVEASSNASQSHVSPSGAYDAVTGDIYALWRETDAATQGQIGVHAQRIDSAGNRQWGSGGKVLVALSSTDQTQMKTLIAPGGLLATWVSGTSPNPMQIRAARLNSDSSYAWPAEIISVSTAPTDVSRLTGALSSQGFAAYAWTGSASGVGNGDVYVQNLRLDGGLGSAEAIFRNGFD